MQLPERVPFLRPFTLIWVLFSFIWISLEGSLPAVVTMGVATTAVSALHLLQKVGGRVFNRWQWVVGTAVFGAGAGGTAVALTLMFMSIKTGLHAHGPEFTLDEIQWVISQLPIWLTVGGLVGGGLGLISAGVRQ